MEVNLVTEALKFLVLGMSVVLLFLVLMINVIKVQTKLIAKFFPEEKSSVVKKTTAATPQSSDKSKIIAAITGALIHHNNHKS
ncbi:MAG TPA: sodium pump decarboxylase subunit gamma [Campylobacterales bacterium]|nr:sodium pump decarboxylase subunit gamma [Campylobacterales bacterium]